MELVQEVEVVMVSSLHSPLQRKSAGSFL